MISKMNLTQPLNLLMSYQNGLITIKKILIKNKKESAKLHKINISSIMINVIIQVLKN